MTVRCGSSVKSRLRPTLETLLFPPSNRLHPLLGKRNGSHAIRINDQWRITFTWGSQGPENVRIEDYH